MPLYSIRGLDGKIYSINGPPGVTKEQIKAKILERAPQAGVPPQGESVIERIPVVGGVLGQLADYPAVGVEGLAGTAKSITDVFGANNVASNFLQDVSEGARSLRSEESRASEKARAIRSKLAEGKGVSAEVGAALRNYIESPFESTAQVAGSALPFIGAALVAPEAGATAAMLGLGALSGAGTIKGDIYDAVYEETKNAALQKGMSDEAADAKAKEVAEQAQEYGGKNLDQIALGSVLGAAASATGFSRQIAGTIGRRASARVAARLAEREAAEAAGEEIARKSLIRGGVAGMAEEAIPEAAQEGQEQYASNLALQREGFDVDPFAGVAGRATAAGIASLPLGGYGGVRETNLENTRATERQYAKKVSELPDNPTEEDVAPIAEWAVRRGFSEEEAQDIARNAAAYKAREAKARAEREEAQRQAMEERTAGVEPSPEPDINAPGMPGPEEELTPPPVDPEEQAAMERARAEEMGAEPVAPAAAPPAQPSTNNIPIPYESLRWNEANNRAEPFSGVSDVINYSGRMVVVRDVNGVRVPFYLSTGSGGKANVAAGKWYPFFGIGADGWINKTTEADINDYYGSPTLRAVAEELDNTIGDIRKDDTVPKVKATGSHIAAINANLSPAENGTSETIAKVRENIANTVNAIEAGQSTATQPAQPSMAPYEAEALIRRIEVEPELQSEVEAATGLTLDDLYDIADSGRGPVYSRGRRPKDTETANMFGALPEQVAPSEALKREEFNAQRFAAPEQRAALQEQATQQMESGQERAAALQQREAEQREETLGDIEYALRAQAPENAVYKVDYDPTDTNAPYKLLAETQLGKKPEVVLRAPTLQDFSDQVYSRMMELTPYVPEAPAAIEEIEQVKPTEQEAPTVATRMVQDFTAEVDAAREAGKIDNNQRAQLLGRLQRPNAYRVLNGRQVANDAIAKLEEEALAAASAVRNASAEEKAAAEAAQVEVNKRLHAAVKNSLLNPARAALRSMIEMRQDEKLGARIRQQEAEQNLGPAQVQRRLGEMEAEQRNIPTRLADVGPEWKAEKTARQEVREAGIDLKEAKVQKYRRAPTKGGVAAPVVQQVVNTTAKGWAGPKAVNVVQSIDDIPDARVRRAIQRDNATDAEGLVAPDGTVYLVADNIKDEARAKAVLFHEALGHVGLAKLFREQLDDVLTKLYNSNADLKADTDRWVAENPDAYASDENPLARAVEEVLAERSEAGQIKLSLLNRIAAVIRNFARRMRIPLSFSNADIQAILAAAHERAIGGSRESQLVKGVRYIREDRVRPSPVAAKTFLRELGIFNGRELMDMPSEDAVRAASRVGIDQEWLDYFNSQQLAARAPEGAAPIRLPQPDMAKYMPKYSKRKTTTSTADAAKLAKADERLSDGARRVEKSFSTSGMVDGVEEMSAGRSFKDWAGALWSNWNLFSPAKQKAILKVLPSSGILGWVKPDFPALHAKMQEIDERVHKMNALKQRILAASDDLARQIQDFVDKHGVETLAKVQAMARINEVAPDEFASAAEALKKNAAIVEIERRLLANTNDAKQTRQLIDEIKALVMENKDSVRVKGDKFTMAAPLITKLRALEKLAVDASSVKQRVDQLAEMTRRVRDTHQAWDALGKQKGGHEVYKEMRSFYKDMFEAELALLDARIDQLADEDEAIRMKDMRAKLMQEIAKPEERKKQGDLFWDLDGDLFQKDYFPFMREGKYWLRVAADKAGTREREFYTRDTEREIREVQKQVAARLGVDPENNEGIITTGLDIGELQDYLRTEDALMQRVFDIVGKARDKFARTNKIDLKELTDSIYQTWLMTTPERSVRRRLMHAEEVVGFSSDVFLHFRKQATAYANQLSKLAYAGKIKMAVEEARDVINDPERPVTEKAKWNAFVSEFETRADQELNPQPQNAVANLLSRSSYYYYLTSAKTAMLQLTSIPIRVVPRLWRDYGYVKGTGMWLKYMQMWNSLGRVKVERESTRYGDRLDALMPNVNGSQFVRNSADLRWARKMGTERGILETTHDTIVQNERATPKKTATGARRKAEDIVGNTAKTMSFMFNGMENISRQAAYYMTFELALDKFRKDNPDASDAEAREYAFRQAMDMVRNTLGDYSSWERPSIAKNNFTRALFLFKMHPITQTRFMVGAMRDIITDAGGERAGALKELTGVLMMAGMFGGVMGMPLYSAMTYALMAAFGPDDEDDEDVRALMGKDVRTAYDPDIAFRTWMNEKFGDITLGGMSLADVLTSGPISTALNTELASSTTLDLKNMWFRDAVVGDNLEDTMVATAIANIAGLSMVSQMLRGYESFKEGNIADGLKKTLPAFARTWVSAGVNEVEGVKNRRGDVLIPKEDISAADNIRDVLGFRAPKLTRIQQYYITRAKNEDAIKSERKGILDRFERAVLNQEITSRADFDKFVKEEVVPFNRTYPDPEFLITEETMAESIKRRAGIRARTIEGVQFDKKTAAKDITAQRAFVR